MVLSTCVSHIGINSSAKALSASQNSIRTLDPSY
nr:MAG TPA: hypothetical protein [Caudoviricetes sp.]